MPLMSKEQQEQDENIKKEEKTGRCSIECLFGKSSPVVCIHLNFTLLIIQLGNNYVISYHKVCTCISNTNYSVLRIM